MNPHYMEWNVRQVPRQGHIPSVTQKSIRLPKTGSGSPGYPTLLLKVNNDAMKGTTAQFVTIKREIYDRHLQANVASAKNDDDC